MTIPEFLLIVRCEGDRGGPEFEEECVYPELEEEVELDRLRFQGKPKPTLVLSSSYNISISVEASDWVNWATS
jgi:hypothetical protein